MVFFAGFPYNHTQSFFDDQEGRNTMKNNEGLNAGREKAENIDFLISDEQLADISAGASTTGICPYCHKYVTITVSGSSLVCNSCGKGWTAAY